LRDVNVESVENELSTPSNDVNDNKVMPNSNEVPKDPKFSSPKPYALPFPFPQRIAKAILDLQFGKFLEVLMKLCINIPFTDTLSQMPSYAKFLKEILSNKRKLEEHETIALTEECSTAIQNKLPAKLKDLNNFSIPSLIGNVCVDHALFYLRSSVSLMPHSMCKKLDLGELRPTTISLQLANCSMKYYVGVFEDVPIKVGIYMCQLIL